MKYIHLPDTGLREVTHGLAERVSAITESREWRDSFDDTPPPVVSLAHEFRGIGSHATKLYLPGNQETGLLSDDPELDGYFQFIRDCVPTEGLRLTRNNNRTLTLSESRFPADYCASLIRVMFNTQNPFESSGTLEHIGGASVGFTWPEN